MVLQRGLPVHVWGWADAGEEVSVALAGKRATTKADASGRWSIGLAALATGENLELTIQGKNRLTLKNVVIGDLWVCSGQSNMEMDLNGCVGAAKTSRPRTCRRSVASKSTTFRRPSRG